MTTLLLVLALGLANEDARPLIESRCSSCHGPDKVKGGLRVDSRAALLKGGDSGPAIVPGRPEESLLYLASAGKHPELRMPPKEMLAAAELERLRRWIAAGAPWEAAGAADGRLGDAWSDVRNPVRVRFGGERLDLWSLKPIARSEPPAVRGADRVRTPVDRFVIAGLEAAKLGLSPEASRRVLIRRLAYDLTGLPPAPGEVRDFVSDPAPDAYERLVERLLVSPRYGEAAARQWMDVVRYADTQGFERDEFQPLVWRYRDYLVRSFNADKPFARFVREQLAGDLLVKGAPRSAEDVDALVATAYLRLGPVDSTGSIFEENAKNRNELLGDLANTTASAFLGLTYSCANCHDHKYDPLLQADHFRMRAFFAGVKRQDDTVIDLASQQEARAAAESRAADLDKERKALLDPVRKAIEDARRKALPEEVRALLDVEKPGKEQKEKLKPHLEKLKPSEADVLAGMDEAGRARARDLAARAAGERASLPVPVRAMTVREAGGAVPPTHVFAQGDFTRPLERVMPGLPSALDPNAAADPTRLGLADWIASPSNPLAARVLVNRVWQRHFGRGLVATPNDFGFSGARPTHPALLDWLASEFLRSGGSIKSVHRAIVLSSAYRQASGDREEARRGDPENRLLWRQNVRRRDAEGTRDAVLAVSGLLRERAGGAPLWPPVPQDLLDGQPGILETKSDKAAKDRLQGWFTDREEDCDVRSVFLVQKRSLALPFLQPFDLPDPTTSCGRRDATTVAPQAMQLLNSRFAERASLSFAARVERDAGSGAGERVVLAVRLALGRDPVPAERDRLAAFAERRSLAELCRALLNLNEFVYVD